MGCTTGPAPERTPIAVRPSSRERTAFQVVAAVVPGPKRFSSVAEPGKMEPTPIPRETPRSARHTHASLAWPTWHESGRGSLVELRRLRVRGLAGVAGDREAELVQAPKQRPQRHAEQLGGGAAIAAGAAQRLADHLGLVSAQR